MFYIASTRFNNITWNENIHYRKKIESKGAIYGVSIKIHEKYLLNSLLFVVEMNNDTNNICGIGLIRNSISIDKQNKIYSDDNYNRFIYRGNYWISRDYIKNHDSRLIEILENILFKGKSHLKRQSGISVITPKLFAKWNYNEEIVKDSIKNIFVNEFKEVTI
jgi:phage pi2 protein 07